MRPRNTHKGEVTDKRKKTLINLGEHRKEWIKKVVELAGQAGTETNQTELINILVDQAMVEDPESFIVKLAKVKARSKLADIERREEAIRREKEALVAEIGDANLTKQGNR